MATRVYRETITIPISVTWHQELVDDGPGGEDFYVRVTPHINLGGKKGFERLAISRANKNYGDAIWREKDLRNVIANNHKLASLSTKMERETTDFSKKALVKKLKEQNTHRPAPATTPTQVGDMHKQALERTRRAHGISLEDQAAGESLYKEADQKIDSKAQMAELQKQYNTEEDAAFMAQLAGKSNAGYQSIINDLNKTKVGYDDNDYDY